MKHIFTFAVFCFVSFLAAEQIEFRNGNLTDGQGKQQFLVGTEYSYVQAGKLKLYGKLWRGKYPDEYRYLYETNPDQAYFESIGFNTLHLSSFPLVVSALFPGYTPAQLDRIFEFYQEGLVKHNLGKIKRMWGIRPFQDFLMTVKSLKTMPHYLDLHFPSSSVLAQNRKEALLLLQEEALTDGGSSFSIGYNLGSRKGRDVLKKIYSLQLELFRKAGARPYMYKIFNEPRYKNFSPYNLRLFADWLERKFGSVSAMNRAWNTSYVSFAEVSPLRKSDQYSIGAAVEYGKMQETQLTETAVELRELIRRFDCKPVFIQLLGGEHAMSLWHNCNIYDLHSRMDAISPGTGNFTFNSVEETDDSTPAKDALPVSTELKIDLLRHGIYFPLAEGKAYMNTEAYVGRNKGENFRAVLWRELGLGKHHVLFWSWFGMEPPGIPLPNFALLNPGVQPPQELKVIPEFRKDLERIADLFLDRENKLYAPHAAFLYSNPTLRIAALAKNQGAGLEPTLDFVSAMHFNHYDYVGIFEENLQEKLNGIPVLFLGGVSHIYRDTHRILKQYLENGGIVIASGATFRRDEYDQPIVDALIDFETKPVRKVIGRIPEYDIRAVLAQRIRGESGWQVAGTLSGEPAVIRKKLGKGELWYIAAELRDYALAEFLKPILARKRVTPYARVFKTDRDDTMPNIEVFPFRKRTEHGTLYGYLVFNQNKETKCFRIAAPGIVDTVFEPITGELYPVENGFVTVKLQNQDCRVLVAGDKSEWMKRFPSPVRKTPFELRKETELAVREEREKCTVRKSVSLDIRNITNTGFENSQKWSTDSAFADAEHRYLRGVPFHKQRFGDILFDIIRFDYNENKVCIALRSRTQPDYPAKVSIPVDRRCGDLMILQACVGGRKGDPVLKYRIHYLDGTVRETLARKGFEIGDWKIARNPEPMRKSAVWNDDGYGFFLYELENPFPSKIISALELESCGSEAVPVVCAVSALETIFTKEYQHSIPVRELFPIIGQPAQDPDTRWNGTDFQFRSKYVELKTENGKPHPLFDSPEKIDGAVLRGSIRWDRDELGKAYKEKWVSILFLAKRNGGKASNGPSFFMRSRNRLSSYWNSQDGSHWIEFEIPLKEIRGNLENMESIAVFPGRNPVMKYIRSFRLEF